MLRVLAMRSVSGCVLNRVTERRVVRAAVTGSLTTVSRLRAVAVVTASLVGVASLGTSVQAQTGVYQVFARSLAQAGCYHPINPAPWAYDYQEDNRGTPPRQPGSAANASASASAGGSNASGSAQTDLAQGSYSGSFSGTAQTGDDNCAGVSGTESHTNVIDDLAFTSTGPGPITVTFSIRGTQSLSVGLLHPEDRTEPYEPPFITNIGSNFGYATTVTGDAYPDGFGNAILRITQGSQSGQLHVTAPGSFYYRVYFEATAYPSVVPWTTAGQPYSYSGSASASFRLESLPPGVTCISASGLFPGCEHPAPPPPPPPLTSVPGKSLGAPQVCFGNPCDVATGNKFEQSTDYESAGPHVLALTRSYNSLAGAVGDSSFGRHWRGSLDRSLRLDTATSVSARRADGRILTFTGANGTWTTDADVDVTLTNDGNTWTLTDSDDSVETYRTISGGRAILTSITARNGYQQSLLYDTAERLTRVSDSYGRNLDFTYSNGLVETVTTPEGLVITYGYDISGATPGIPDRLASVRYGAVSRTYLYDDPVHPFALTGVIDENGRRFATWTYDVQGRAITSEHAGGAERAAIEYHDADGSRTVTDALGLRTVYRFATIQGVPRVTQMERLATATTASATRTFTYDANGHLASSTDWNGTLTTYVNDARGLPTAIAEAAGTPLERTRTITYDARFHVPTQIVAPGVTTDLVYDAAGNLLTRTETDTTTTTVPYATAGTRRTWTYTWADGLLTAVQGPRTDVTATTQYAYTNGALSTVTNALGHVTRVTAHTPGGRPLTIVDPNGVTTDLTYDGRQRLTARTVHTAAGDRMTQYAYNPAGDVIRVTPPDGAALTLAYDDARRLIGIEDILGQRVAYTLDALGNRTSTEVRAADGIVTRTQGATFDAQGYQVTATGGAGQATRYTVDANGNVRTITDPLDRLTQQDFDALNRLTTLTDTALGLTTTTYDTADRPLSVTAPNGAVTTYTYDGFGNLLQSVSADAGRTVYRYDLAGNLVRKTDATGAVTRYVYDALNRVRAMRFPATPSDDVTYVYDQTAQPFGIGRLTTVNDAVGRLHRVYDERGLVQRETRTREAVTLTTAYTYDAAGRLTRLRYPSGAQVLYGRDSLGRVSDVRLRQPSTSARVVATDLRYLPYGPLRGLTYGNGITETRAFDRDYRLTTVASTGVQPVQQLAYTYDAADNVRDLLDGIEPAHSQAFGYDALNHLTAAVGGYGSQAWTYDGVGNRLTQQVGSALTTYTYAPASNRLTRIQTGSARQLVSHTRAGNIALFDNRPVGPANTSLVYNDAGRLAQVLVGTTPVQGYTYDGFGRRLVKSSAALGLSLYQYDLAGHLLEDADGQGRARIDYLYLDDRPLATLQLTTGQLAFLHTDRLDTPQLATDAAQATVWRARYEPFGAAHVDVSAIGQSLRFPGQEFEQETGWHQNGFRDYLPALGRYLESDPIGLAGGVNTYSYAGANPIAHFDRSGLADDSTYWHALDTASRAQVILGFVEGFTLGPEERSRFFATFRMPSSKDAGAVARAAYEFWTAADTVPVPPLPHDGQFDYGGYSCDRLRDIRDYANDQLRIEQQSRQAGESIAVPNPMFSRMRRAADEELRRRGLP